MIDFLKVLVEHTSNDDAAARAEELRIATAALLVHASAIDGRVDDSERETLKMLLKEEFALDSAALDELIAEAHGREREAVDLYQFTSVISRELDRAGRAHLVSMLWEVVFADGVEDPFESNLVWRVSELVGVTGRDRVLIKKAVQETAGLS